MGEFFLDIKVELVPGLFKDIGQALRAHFADAAAKDVVEHVGLEPVVGFVVAECGVDRVGRLALKRAFAGSLDANVGVDFDLRLDQRDIGVP